VPPYRPVIIGDHEPGLNINLISSITKCLLFSISKKMLSKMSFFRQLIIVAFPLFNLANAACKAVPGSADWPSISAWAALNASLGGQLIQPTPPGAVCHSDEEGYDAALCTTVATDCKFCERYPYSTMNIYPTFDEVLTELLRVDIPIPSQQPH
jgi:hypothetical protein